MHGCLIWQIHLVEFALILETKSSEQ